jgi:heparosan-N-sulfate-glucuronate 5-epimerase
VTRFQALLPRQLYRPPQRLATFEPGAPSRGYYNDLTVELARYGPSPAHGRAALVQLTKDRRLANPIDIAQLGLGAFQMADRSPEWSSVARSAAQWIANDLDGDGGLAFRFAMPHTFLLSPPWYSAMAQGEAASLLVRASEAFGEVEFAEAAMRACRLLTDPQFRLIDQTPDGPVLQEYPIEPPPHVLNGWIFALWGLYDVGQLGRVDSAVANVASDAFDLGVRTLCRRLPLYELRLLGWSRYDLYPHRIVHVASPFYHRLHIAQLAATARLRPDLSDLTTTADRWAAAARNPVSLATACVCKVTHRLLSPQRRVR